MAPQYAPSLRFRLAPILLLIQIFFIAIFACYFEIDSQIKARDGTAFNTFYPEFQDVNVMVILGFGFLGTFLVRYGFSSTGFNLLVAVLAVQWALILNGLESWYYRGKIVINLRSLVYAEICAVPALISIGTILGKTNPVHLTLIALFEVSGFVLNDWLLHIITKVRPLNSIMLLHIYGAFFGLMLTWFLYRKGSEQLFEKEKLSHTSGLFSMLGTLFLWMFWPTFNSVLVDNYPRGRKFEAVCSTYLSLAVSAVTAAAVSVVTSPKGKLNLVQIQSSILAGGVVIGVAMPVVHKPWEAMTLGFLAAVLSTIGYKYLKNHMVAVFQCHDTCSILSTYGLPGLLGWLAQFLLLKDFDDHTTAIRFAVFHITSLFITLSLSLSAGIITGILLKWKFWKPPQDRKCFDDQAFWEFPHLVVKK
ncbi:rh blood group, D antigen [Boleophthalmus pectinirostris]|uniref:rh blood group, D antigen n=1 Tax=Boleophthalmus pectinirostris TaxID=150288 RepID=UPI000A1C64AA|nr:rh blood group, D antigen [Boleophthalmus pectinirostris]